MPTVLPSRREGLTLPGYDLYALISPNHAARLREQPLQPKQPAPRLVRRDGVAQPAALSPAVLPRP